MMCWHYTMAFIQMTGNQYLTTVIARHPMKSQTGLMEIRSLPAVGVARQALGAQGPILITICMMFILPQHSL